MSEVKGNIVRIKSGNDQYAIKDTISDYLTNENLSSYLTKNDAESIYVKLANFASKVFELNSDTDNPYLTKSDAQILYYTNQNASALSSDLVTLDTSLNVIRDQITALETITPEAPITNGQYFFKYDSTDTNHYTWEKSAIPTLPTTNGQYLLKYNSANDNHYTWDQLAITELPPTGSLANGTYTLQCEKTANGTTLSWVSTSSSST